MDTLSLIIPCYNEVDNIKTLYDATVGAVGGIGLKSCEFLFIDDGSTDGTVSEIKKLAQTDKNVKCISFTRNFGKEAAMLAGLKNSSGEMVAIIDADMQHPPNVLRDMVLKLKSSPPQYEHNVINRPIDCVAAKRTDRKGDSKFRSFLSRRFYKIINKIAKIQLIDGVGDFRVMRRRMVDALLSLNETNRFSKALFNWTGFNTEYVEFENVPRFAGKTKWSFGSLVKYSLDGILSFSTFPLKVILTLGIIISLSAFFCIVYFILDKFLHNAQPQGYATMMVAILFMGGIQMLSIGLLGLYSEKIFIEVKKRPMYVINESINMESKGER